MGNSPVLGSSQEYLKTLENTEHQSSWSRILKQAPRYPLHPQGSAGLSYFPAGPLTHPSSLCNFEGKSFDKCL